MLKNAIFLKFQMWVFGRCRPIRSAQLSGPTEIFYITQIQKLKILTQKNIPPKKGPFFEGVGGGGEITRPLNPSITWAGQKQCLQSCQKFLVNMIDLAGLPKIIL